MRSRPAQALPYLLAFVLGVGAAGLAACGGTNKALIPATNADALKSDLAAVGSAIDANDCTTADRALAQVKTDLAELPRGTSVRLQRKLEEGYSKLAEQSAKECQETTATTVATIETVTTAPTTTTTAPPTTTTAPPTTTTAPTTVPTTPTTTPTSTADTGGVTTP